MATYYVDSASSGGNGTTTATSGANAAFATLAAANAAVTGDQHGNSLLLKKGCTFNETCTLAAYGTAAGQFTLGAYGTTGADPIISGWGSAITGFSEEAGGYTMFDSDTGAVTVGPGVGDAASDYFRGQNGYSFASTKVVSRIDINCYFVAGDVSAKTFNIRVYTLSGNNLDALQGTSDNVAGTSMSSGTWVPFYFTTPVTLTGGVSYAIVVTMGGTDAANYILLGAHAAASVPGTISGWASDKSYADGSTNDMNIKLYVSAGESYLWDKTGVTTQPYAAKVNGAMGTLKASVVACTAAGDWFWAANTLTVYYPTDPSGLVYAGAIDPLINLSGLDYVTIDGLRLEGANTSGWSGALTGSGNQYVTVKNCTLTMNGGDGADLTNAIHCTFDTVTASFNGKDGLYFLLTSTTPDTSTANEVKNCILNDNGYYGMATSSNVGSTMRHTAFSIHDNVAYNNSTGIYVQFIDSSNIYNNECYANNKRAGETYGMGISSTASCNFYNNSIHDNADVGVDFYGDNTVPYGPCTNNKFYLNRVYNHTTGTGYITGFALGSNTDAGFTGNEIYYNLLWNNTYDFAHDHAHEGTKVWNNVFYGAATTSLWIQNDNPGLEIKNNAFSASAVLLNANVVTTGLTHSNNCYYRASGNLATYNGTTYTGADILTFEASAVKTDPLFVSTSTPDFHLQNGSPCIDAGANVGLTSDYDGGTVGTNPDIGAYEKVSSSAGGGVKMGLGIGLTLGG